VPCIFCLAVFVMLAGSITTVVLDQMEQRLSAVAAEPVVREVDSDSVAAFRTSVVLRAPNGAPASRPIPARVTVYKRHKRVRIQVLTHDVSRAEAEALENVIANALGLRIVDRSNAHDEQKVREAFGDDARTEAEEDTTATADRQSTAQPRREQPR
jgi:endonuclease/exonuclease/phosphatase (EEP) superfamily protein YafD